jgi:hypothetical protein
MIVFSVPFFRKVFTAFATAGVAIQAIFFSDYHVEGFEDKEHVFSHVQRDAREWVDRTIYGIDLKPKPAKNDEPRSTQ